jgi:hypothetical protein
MCLKPFSGSLDWAGQARVPGATLARGPRLHVPPRGDGAICGLLPNPARAVLSGRQNPGRGRRTAWHAKGDAQGPPGTRTSPLESATRGSRIGTGGAAACVVVAGCMAATPVPTVLVSPTVKAAAAGHAATSFISAKVASLTQGVIRAMFFTRLKPVLGLLLIASVVAVGGTLALRTRAEPPTNHELSAPQRTLTGELHSRGGKLGRDPVMVAPQMLEGLTLSIPALSDSVPAQFAGRFKDGRCSPKRPSRPPNRPEAS